MKRRAVGARLAWSGLVATHAWLIAQQLQRIRIRVPIRVSTSPLVSNVAFTKYIFVAEAVGAKHALYITLCNRHYLFIEFSRIQMGEIPRLGSRAGFLATAWIASATYR